MTPDLWLYLAIGFGAALVGGGLVWWLGFKSVRRFGGQSSRDLNTAITRLEQTVATLTKQQEAMMTELDRHDDRLKKSLSHCQIVRFNPFAGQGGNHSFSAAWLSETGNGLVMSGLYSRDKVHVYAKPVASFASNHELTAEEQAVIGQAKTTRPTRKV